MTEDEKKLLKENLDLATEHLQFSDDNEVVHNVVVSELRNKQILFVLHRDVLRVQKQVRGLVNLGWACFGLLLGIFVYLLQH